MDAKLPLLPIGMSAFGEIRNEGRLYVDKTSYFSTLKNFGKSLFLSRPRRFGKTLAISAMDSYFSGDKESFKGLAAEESMNSPNFVSRPVIRLTMSAPSGSDSKGMLEEGIMFLLQKNATRHGVKPRGGNSANMFACLVEDIKKANQNKDVVLLIDEYDAPVIKVIQDPALLSIPGLLNDTRSVMSNFYGKIKDLDEDLDFVFITGVTKFSRMGIFSSLNSLKDISLAPEFASFVGFTHAELLNNFSPFIGRTAEKHKLSDLDLVEKTKDFYNGFSFDGKVRLYNPFSIMNFFQDGQFDNFWMQSGSDTFIREMLKNKKLTVEQFRGLGVDRSFAASPGEIDQTPPAGFLYQVGYLTLRENPNYEPPFFLDYPNFEVRSSMSELVLSIASTCGEARFLEPRRVRD